jgi:type II secretory pathway predicted ATPase ExeA
MFETFLGFKKEPFSQNPDPQQLYESRHWNQLRARLQFVVDHRGVGLITGEVGSGKSTAIRTILGTLNPNLYKLIYIHWTASSVLDLLRLMARGLDLEPAHGRADLVHQIAEAIIRFHKTKKQHPILALDESQLLSHEALQLLPLLLNFEMDSCQYLSLLLVGQPLLRRTLSLQTHEALRQRIAVHYHLEGLSREELDSYLAHQLKAAGVPRPWLQSQPRSSLF